MSFIKKVRESRKILDAANDALEMNDLIQGHIRELLGYQAELIDNAKNLLDLHRQMMDTLDVQEVNIERDLDVPLKIHTTHGVWSVGALCPEHKILHSDRGEWYICVDGGRIDVTGWHKSTR